MKWRARKNVKTKADYGDTRWVRRYAALPVRTPGCWLWLEFYLQKQKFVGYWENIPGETLEITE